MSNSRHIVEHIFEVVVVAFYCKDMKPIERFADKLNISLGEEDKVAPAVWYYDDCPDIDFLVWLPRNSPDDADHEAVHIADFVLESRGVDDAETRAYYTCAWQKILRKFLKDSTKKRRKTE